MSVLRASHRYLLTDLVTACSQYLIAELSSKNVLRILVFSDVYGLQNLKDECVMYLSQVLSREEMKELQGYEEYVQYANHSTLTEDCLDEACFKLGLKENELVDRLFFL
ncbi:hypothetical protein HDE_08807 [Halotydeus destructor]|nr:hypothetical protein HDE_08807 [Halotydeus destructor]